jgi:hypothetical protein
MKDSDGKGAKTPFARLTKHHNHSLATFTTRKMPSTTSRLILLLVTIVLSLAESATLFQFNGADDTTKFCDAAQWTLVQTTIATAGKRRFLADRRRLNGSCTGCGPYCVKSGTGCVIRGRRLDETNGDATETNLGNTAVVVPSESTDAAHRELVACDTEMGEMARVHAALDALAPNLTAPCRSLISSQRNFTCAKTTQDCFVQSFNLWDVRTNSIMTTDFKSGGSFCGSIKRRLVPVSFEAQANFYIGKMQFVVRGVGNGYFANRTEYSAPYFLNGNCDNGAPGPVYFHAGDYVLTATSEDDARQAKSISFQVRNC